MTEFTWLFEAIGVIGLLVAILAEIDISRHRKEHERRERVRRATDRRCDCLTKDGEIT